MPATDYITAVYDQIWSLLEGHAPFTALVKPGNRIKLSGNALNPSKVSVSEADFPEALLGLGQLTDAQFADAPQLAAPDLIVAFVEPMEQVYLLTLTLPDLRIGPANQLLMEVLTALRQGGAQLGLAYVDSWGPVVCTQAKSLADPASMREARRLVTTLSIPVKMVFQGDELLT